MKYKAIIFDVSDTLVEYSPNYAKIFGDRLRKLGVEVCEETAKQISRVVNWTIGEQVQRENAGEPKISESELNQLLDSAALLYVHKANSEIQKFMKALKNMPMPKQIISVIPGALEVLTELQNKYRLAIVSNHCTWLEDHLKEIGLAPYFESITISDVVGVAKPNIKIMDIALNELGLKADECLYVGDQPIDVLCSKQVGMDCAWINRDEVELPAIIPYKEDYRIHKLGQLLELI